MDYLDNFEKYPLAKPTDNVLLGVKIFKNQSNAIYENSKSIKKVGIDLCDLMKVIQWQNINDHITTSWESFTQYIGNYKPPISVLNVDQVKEKTGNNILIEQFTINNMDNIPCWFDRFNDLIKLYNRIKNNPDVCTYKVPLKFIKRYQRFLN